MMRKGKQEEKEIGDRAISEWYGMQRQEEE